MDAKKDKIWRVSFDLDAQPVGPFTIDGLIEMARNGNLRPEHMISMGGQWKPAGEMPGLFKRTELQTVVERRPAEIATQPPPVRAERQRSLAMMLQQFWTDAQPWIRSNRLMTALALTITGWLGFSAGQVMTGSPAILEAEQRGYTRARKELAEQLLPLAEKAEAAALAQERAKYAHVGRRPDEPALPAGAPADFWVRVWAQRNALENLQRRLRSDTDGGFGLRVVSEQTRLGRGESYESAHHVVLRNANTSQAYTVLIWQSDADRQDGKVRWVMSMSRLASEGTDFGY